MANTTRAGALSIHGTNPQYLVPTVIRQRVYDTLYWKEHCFALTSATVIDRAVELNAIGGTYANTRPTEFICLVLKLLQLQPEREIVLEYLRAEEFKYLRALAAFYVRLTFDSLNCYEVLEPLLNDYRKLRFRAMDGSYSIMTIDEFADQLLHGESACEIQLPRLTQRKVLEETEGLPPRRSKLGRALGVRGAGEHSGDEAGDGSGSDAEGSDGARGGGGRYLSRSPSASSGAASDDNDDNEGRYISRSPSPAGSDGRFVSRSPTRSASPVERFEVEHVAGDV
ncbi:PRP38 family-domain-containing protein [Rhodotorula diobovata]|uniref:Pre-mRNA-splicing factor 38 n=1 Tax=Rhodotorula diobovata TaxID=5288 RepID=A0A5C5FZ92_9BASI|nr:PRP38 family-domain-containing protein [Rhodotorula diobovata]